MLNALENYYWRYCSASELVNMILAFIETRAASIFNTKQFLELSESMVQLIMNRNLEAPEITKYVMFYSLKNTCSSNISIIVRT